MTVFVHKFVVNNFVFGGKIKIQFHASMTVYLCRWSQLKCLVYSFVLSRVSSALYICIHGISRSWHLPYARTYAAFEISGKRNRNSNPK